jgi:hypothetical protein
LGSESETCVGSHVRLVGVSISFEKNFYRLPFTPPPSLVCRISPSKTLNEIIAGKKPSLHHFRVFGCKCFILDKKPKASKFASKVDEGFLIGYGTNEHAYHVFNKTTGCVETTIDVKFDESNGSQREQVSETL